MVSPIYSIIIALGAGFLIPLLAQLKRRDASGSVLSAGVFYLAAAALVVIPASFVPQLLAGGDPVVVFTAGARPPLSINLELGLSEAVVLVLANLVGLLAALSMQKSLWSRGATGYVLFLMMMLGVNGLILTRDLFNVFVFLEIMAIGTYGIVSLDDRPEQFAAGFKYLIAGGISSVLVLLGTVYLYRVTGTLNIDGMVAAAGTVAAAGPAAFTAGFLLFAGILIELKPMPANGWALDAYHAANPGVSSFISAGNATAVLFVLYKVIPLFGEGIVSALIWLGIITFAIANLLGLRQDDSRRMLGYSSVAQVGLIAAVLGIVISENLSNTYLFVVAGGFLVNHMLAKGGLFWIASAERESAADSGVTEDGKGSRSAGARPVAGVGAVLLGLALVGLPPFPGFWAKWQLVNTLVAGNQWVFVVLILLGSLFEAIYILRWTGGLIARSGFAGAAAGGGAAKAAANGGTVRLNPGAGVGVIIVTVLLGAAGIFIGWTLGMNDWLVVAPFVAAAALLLLEWLPARIRGLIAAAAIAGYAYLIYPLASGLALIFGALFAAGGIIAVVVSLYRQKTQFGTYPLYVLAATSLTGLVVAAEPVTFFILWELMTVGSYLLIARSGRQWTGAGALTTEVGAGLRGNGGGFVRGEGVGARRAAVSYIAFSIGGALLIMVGLIVAQQAVISGAGGQAVPEIFGADGYVRLPALTGGWPAGKAVQTEAAGVAARVVGQQVGGLGEWAQAIPTGANLAVFILIGLGLLVKMAAIGLHIWLPDAYAEADNDVTAFLSSALSKAGVFALLALVIMLGSPALGASSVTLGSILGWIGAATALFGALLAVFQEDVKRLLAYSSMSQVGYMVLGISMATHLGWVSGIYLAVLHFVFKGLLFVGMTGVIHRTGTRNMYEMGGLIKRMPLTFIAVLMSIIALSGVPPLAGFGGKWLIYTALMESGWFVQTGVAFFASTIAFLYLFRMIHTVFLGQLKDEHREVKEAPLVILLPLVILMGGLMLMSMYPNLILKPIMGAIEPFIASTVQWQDYTVITTLGYWNGNLVMYVTMGVFILPLAWLMIVMRRPQKVKQFNVVFAAERPERPETTHFAHNFFAPYRKALGFLSAPALTRGWKYLTDGVLAVAGAIRQIYTGNGQTYALHILLVTVVLYLVTGGL